MNYFLLRVLILGASFSTSNTLASHAPRFGISLGNTVSPLIGLTQRQEERTCTIPGGVQCPNAPEFCCLPSEICQLDTFQCCPSYGLQCNGQACCDPAISICCPSVFTGCCVKGATCCGDDCCSPEETCNQGQCILQVVPTKTSAVTSIATETTTTACALLGLDKRQGAGGSCVASGTPTSTETPVPTVKPLIFDYKKLSTKRKPKYNAQQMTDRQDALQQLFTNMCLGLEVRDKLTTQSEVYTFLEDEAKKSQNRKAVGCTGSPCAGFPGQSCDEFPFASTMQGGANAIWNCIPEMAQNIQGGVISSWKSRNKITEGTAFELQIVNYDCNDPPSPPIVRKQQDFNIALPIGTGTKPVHSTFTQLDNMISVMSLQQDAFPSFDDSDPYNHTIISLGDFSAGSYKISTQVNGTVNSAYVIDNEGEQFAQVMLPNNTQQGLIELTFTLAYDGIGLAMIMDTFEDQIFYNATLLSVPSNSTTPSPSPSTAGALKARNVGGLGVINIASTLVALFTALFSL